jgi:nucleoside 2-deoxyribosyltransferase
VKIYVAGRFEDRAFLRRQAERLRALGHTVTSSWLWSDVGTTRPKDRDAVRMAYRDLHELEQSDVLIMDTRKVAPRGGREVEFGFAYAEGLGIVRIGPRRNVFHTLIPHTYPNWTSFWQEWGRPNDHRS